MKRMARYQYLPTISTGSSFILSGSCPWSEWTGTSTYLQYLLVPVSYSLEAVHEANGQVPVLTYNIYWFQFHTLWKLSIKQIARYQYLPTISTGSSFLLPGKCPWSEWPGTSTYLQYLLVPVSCSLEAVHEVNGLVPVLTYNIYRFQFHALWKLSL